MNNLPIEQTLIFAITGWCAGLVINYLADALPIRRRITAPFCRYCGNDLPLRLSMFFKLSKCPQCGKGPGWRWIFVQWVCLVGFLWLGFVHPEPLGPAWAMFWFAYILLVIVIDIEHRLIMHVVAAAGMLAGLVCGLQINGAKSTIVGGVMGFFIMLMFYGLGITYARWLSRRKGQEIAEGEALGFGDVTFSLVIGLLLGIPDIFYGLVTAVLLAGLAGLLVIIPALIRKRYDPNLALPYGPFLALSLFYWLIIRS